MIRDRAILCVVPARGGSKGLPRKNLRSVGGVPLVARVGSVIAGMPEIDRAVVSTDDDEIAAVAERSGLTAPFRRPAELSGDRIGDVAVLVHALSTCEQIDHKIYDVVVMLQPTSPLRTKEQVRECIDVLIERDLDSVWTVSSTDSKSHPLKQLVISPEGRLGYYDPSGASIVARQQLSPVFHRNGICYVMTRACLLNDQTLMGRSSGAVVTDEHAISIDTQWDLDFAEYALAKLNGPSGRG